MMRYMQILLLAAVPAFGRPLDSVKPPILLEQVGLGICTGDQDWEFVDHAGEKVYIMLTCPPLTVDDMRKANEGKADLVKRHATVSVGIKHVTTVTVDGDETQKQILELVSGLAANMRRKTKLGSEDEFRLTQLEKLIQELQSRRPKKSEK